MKYMLGVTVCLSLLSPMAQAETQSETLWSDSEAASQVSDDLRDLIVPLTTDHVIEPMLPYHFQAIFSGALRDQVHTLGMSGVYDSPTLLTTLQSTLQTAYDERSPILQAAGLTLARDLTALGFWEIHEPTDNDFHYELSDVEVDSSSSYGIQHLVTVQPYALWDQQAGGYSSDADNDPIYEGGDYFVLKDNTGPGPVYDLTAYQNFLSRLAQQYPEIAYYEIGNEVDGSNSAYANDGASYAELAAASRDTLGNAVTLTNAGAIDIRYSFWEDFFAAGGGDNVDVFNIHYNVEKAGIQSSFSVYKSSLDGYNDVLDGAGVDLPIWITEMGTYADGTSQTEEEQAAWHVKYFAYGAARGVEKFFIDVFGNNTESLGQSAMLYEDTSTLDWTARLLLYTVKLMNNTLSGFTDCEELVEGEQYQFTVNGEPVYVVWGDDALPAELTGETLLVTDIYGNASTVTDYTLTDLLVFITVAPIATITAPAVSTEQSKTKRFTVSWSGADSYDVWYKKGTGDWKAWLADTVETETTFSGKAGKTYSFKVQGMDGNGNAGPESGAVTTMVPYDDSALSYGDSWSKQSVKKAFLKTTYQASQPHSQATLTFSGSEVYVIATVGPRQGRLNVLIDGALKKRLNLKTKKTTYHETVYHKQFSSAKKRRLTLKSSGSKTVALDGIAY